MLVISDGEIYQVISPAAYSSMLDTGSDGLAGKGQMERWLERIRTFYESRRVSRGTEALRLIKRGRAKGGRKCIISVPDGRSSKSAARALSDASRSTWNSSNEFRKLQLGTSLRTEVISGGNVR